MPKPIRVSPSKLELVSQCAASALRCAPFPFTDSAASIRGKDLHERTKILIMQDADGTLRENRKKFEDTFAKVTSGLEEADARAVRICWGIYETLIPSGAHAVYVERKLDTKALLMPYGGTPDLAFYDIASKCLTVVDWKFGSREVPDPDANKQLHAYMLSLSDELKERGFEVSKGFLVVAQPQEVAADSYRTAIIDASEFETLRKNIKAWVSAALVENPAVRPGYHCRGSFCEAAKHPGACPEFDAYAQVKQEARDTAKVEDARIALSGFSPVTVDGPAPQFPIVVLSEEAIARAESLREKVFSTPIVDKVSADIVGLLLQEITKFEGQMDKNRLALKREMVTPLETAIDDASKRGLLPVREAKGEAKIRIDEWIAKENRRIAREQEEVAKAQRLADEKRRAAEEEARRAQEAASKATNEEARRKALIEQAKAQEAARLAAESAPPPSTPVAAPKVAGVRTKLTPVYQVLDFPGMPDDYKLTDEKTLKSAIESKEWGKSGKPAPPVWLKVEWVEASASNGSRR